VLSDVIWRNETRTAAAAVSKAHVTADDFFSARPIFTQDAQRSTDRHNVDLQLSNHQAETILVTERGKRSVYACENIFSTIVNMHRRRRERERERERNIS
jgi:hypothetical protein